MNQNEQLHHVLRAIQTENRRIKRWFVFMLLLVAAALFMGAKPPQQKVLTAQRIVLVDEQGNERATLELAANGPSLALFDSNGQKRASLAVKGKIADLSLADEDGYCLVNLTGAKSGGFGLWNGPRGRKEHVFVGLLRPDCATLQVRDADGRTRAFR